MSPMDDLIRDKQHELPGTPPDATYCDGPHTGNQCTNCVKIDGSPALARHKQTERFFGPQGREFVLNRWFDIAGHPVTDLALDLDQGFDYGARSIIANEQLNVPGYTPRRDCIPLVFQAIVRGNETTVEVPSLRGVTPLVINGRYYYASEPPRGYEYGVRGNRVLLYQRLPGEYQRWFYDIDKPLTDPKLKLKDGYCEKDIENSVKLFPRSGKFELVDKDTLEKVMSKEWDLGAKPAAPVENQRDKMLRILTEVVTPKMKPAPEKHQYHKIPIPKGKTGFFSKIEEEFFELKDAFLQGNAIMLMVELADLFGAVEKFLENNYPGVTLEHVLKQARLTNEVFAKGGREDRDPATDPGTR